MDLKDKWRNLAHAVVYKKQTRRVWLTDEQKERIIKCLPQYNPDQVPGSGPQTPEGAAQAPEGALQVPPGQQAVVPLPDGSPQPQVLQQPQQLLPSPLLQQLPQQQQQGPVPEPQQQHFGLPPRQVQEQLQPPQQLHIPELQQHQHAANLVSSLASHGMCTHLCPAANTALQLFYTRSSLTCSR